MSAETEIALQQIDAVLVEVEGTAPNDDFRELSTPEAARLLALCSSSLARLSPPGSPYSDSMKGAMQAYSNLPHEHLDGAVGGLRALRSDYEAGRLVSLPALIHGAMFADFLEMAQHLLDEGYKDAAAVIAGSTLEGHLRALAEAASMDTEDPEGRPLKAERINQDLRGAGVYEKGDQKSVTAWLDLRNEAAHGHYEKYGDGQVGPMIAGIRDFIRRLPA